jgi:dual specificity phosphatase 12
MQKRQINTMEAVDIIRRIRPFVEPNPGFMEQLDLYHKMRYTTDLDDNPIYQRWLYQKKLETSKAAPERVHFRDMEKAVAGITQVEEGATSEESGMVELRCKKCRYGSRLISWPTLVKQNTEVSPDVRLQIPNS